jgi:ribonuclease VapC
VTRLVRGVIDCSALYAVAHGEPGEVLFREGFARCDELLIAAPTLAEISLVLTARKGEAAVADLDLWLQALAVSVVPFDAGLLEWFRRGAAKFRAGAHPARLNYGDLFSYALAKRLDCPLFFQGMDFARCDVRNAMVDLGYAFSALGVPERTGL